MSFKELFPDFIAGTPIKRRAWKGYWQYKNGQVRIHSKDGSVIDFLETKDIIFTLAGITVDDWEIATSENCSVAAWEGK